MNLDQCISIGDYKEDTFIVEDGHSARHVGSGASRVLATPWMIAFMERVSHRLLADCLPDGYSSVGVLVNVRHLAPSPIGQTIRVKTEITDIDRSKVTFKVEAWDDYELVGSGVHERFVIDTERFLRRVVDKQSRK